MAELLIALMIDPGRIFEELAITSDILRIELGDLGHQHAVVVGIVEIGPVGPVEPVEGQHRGERDIFRHVVPRQRPKLLQAWRIGDHGRAGFPFDAGPPLITEPPSLQVPWGRSRRFT
eukprot:gene6922-9334_t